MDEATSNLDKNSEDKIFKILNDIKSKKIIFYISHKINDIDFFDKIIKI